MRCSAGWLFLILLTVTPAAHAWDPELVTVKVDSGRRGEPRRKGTGMLLQNGNKVYVLTSDHVISHTNKDTTHFVTGSVFGRVPAQYLLADWGTGLALLELQGMKTDPRYPGIAELRAGAVKPRAGDEIHIFGFPFASDVLIGDTRGRIMDPETDRHLFVQISGMIEIGGAHGEFGMSGGPAFDARNEFSGILSHQLLVRKEGKESAPGTWDPGSDSPENHLLAISAGDVLRWLETYFSHPLDFPLYFFQDPMLQGSPQGGVFSGELWFTLLSAFGLPNEFQLVTVPSNPNPSRGYPDPSGFLKELEKIYADGKTSLGWITHFRTRSEDCLRTGCYRTKTRFSSIQGFVHLLNRSDLEACTLFNGPENNTDQVTKKLDDFSKKLRELIGGMATSGVTAPLVLAIDDVCDLIRKDPQFTTGEKPWIGLKAKDLDFLLNGKPYLPAWKEATAADAGRAANLRDTLKDLQITFTRYTH